MNLESLYDSVLNDATSTESYKPPEGEYVGEISKTVLRKWEARDGSSSGVTLDVTVQLSDSAITTATGRETYPVTGGVSLDFDDSGSLAKGKFKNAALGRLREAAGCNTPGQAFGFTREEGCAAPALHGKRVRVRVIHDKEGYVKVKAFGKA